MLSGLRMLVLLIRQLRRLPCIFLNLHIHASFTLWFAKAAMVLKSVSDRVSSGLLTCINSFSIT